MAMRALFPLLPDMVMDKKREAQTDFLPSIPAIHTYM
jgi:hypothetical protein